MTERLPALRGGPYKSSLSTEIVSQVDGS